MMDNIVWVLECMVVNFSCDRVELCGVVWVVVSEVVGVEVLLLLVVWFR